MTVQINESLLDVDIRNKIYEQDYKFIRNMKPRTREEYLGLLEAHYNLKIVPPFPLKMTLEASSYCNLKPPMCPREWMTRTQKHMELKLAEKIIGEISDNGGIYYLAFQRHGEPLLNPHLAEMVRMAGDAGNINVVSCITNGILLTPERARALMAAGLTTLGISFDAVTEEDYAVYRNNGNNYSRVIENIKTLGEIKRAEGFQTYTYINAMTQKTDEETRKRFIDEMSQYVDRVDVYEPKPFVENQDIFGEGKVQAPEYPCPQVWRHIIVLSDGTASLCCIDPNGDLSAGNLYNDRISDIWDGEKARGIRAKHIQCDIKDMEPCLHCPGDERR
ncbi:MAG: radical SAM protein [Thermodesulfovibrionia bacterium]|nr:radical SAM protein [Thermodesulfovibrionia bacterium]